MTTLILLGLACGLAATGALALAIATDYWLYTSEPIDMDSYLEEYPNENQTYDYDFEEEFGDVMYEDTTPTLPPFLPYILEVKMHSGLWRACTYYDNLPEPMPPHCAMIGYFQTWERMDNADTTHSILRAIRRASPWIVASLFLLIVSLGFATVGNKKRDHKTLIGAVLYIGAALVLAMGVIFYISAVNDEISHRKKPTSADQPAFHYRYGWAFFFAGASFICSMISAVVNITIFVKRFPNLEDMVEIVPGLDEKGPYEITRSNASSSHDFESGAGGHNPTIIL